MWTVETIHNVFNVVREEAYLRENIVIRRCFVDTYRENPQE